MNRLQGSVVVLVVCKPEPDVIRSEEVGIVGQGRIFRKIPVQFFWKDHVSKLELALSVWLLVPVELKLKMCNNHLFIDQSTITNH